MNICNKFTMTMQEFKDFIKLHPSEEIPFCGQPSVAIEVVKEGREYDYVCQDCMDRIIRLCAEVQDTPPRFILLSEAK